MAVPHCGLILVGKNLETLLQLLRYFHLSSESFLFSGEKTVNLKTSSFYGVSFHEAVPGGEVHTMKQIYPAFPSYSSFKLKKKKKFARAAEKKTDSQTGGTFLPNAVCTVQDGPARTWHSDSHQLSFFLWSKEINLCCLPKT